MRKTTFKTCLAVATMLLLSGAGCWNQEAAAAVSGSIAGIYYGAITYYRFPGPIALTPRRLFGAVGKDGTGYFISVSPVSGDVQVFRQLEGSGEVPALEYEVPTEGHVVARGARKWKITLNPGAGNKGSYELRGKFNRVDGYAALKLRQLQRRSLSFASRSGVYRGFDLSNHAKVDITLYSDGRLGGTDAAGCRILGTLTRLGNFDVFDAHLTFTGSADCDSAMQGVAFFDTRDRTGRFSGTGSYLYLIGANSEFSHGAAMVLMRRSR